jgi:hypothetical protein
MANWFKHCVPSSPFSIGLKHMKSLCVVLAIVFAISVEASLREKRQLFGGVLGGFLGDGGYHQGAFETLN